MKQGSLLTSLLLIASSSALAAAGWSAVGEVWLRDELVVSYRATASACWLLVEARHQPGWHTYALDNVERARAHTGLDQPETELPTRIDVAGGLLGGGWRQSEPQELSQPALRWYSWGFSDIVYFAAPIAAAPSAITINGQACTESRCVMIDDLEIELPAPVVELPFDPTTLVAVASASSAP